MKLTDKFFKNLFNEYTEAWEKDQEIQKAYSQNKYEEDVDESWGHYEYTLEDYKDIIWGDANDPYDTKNRKIGKREVLNVLKMAYTGVRKGMTLNVGKGIVQLVQEEMIIREWKKESPSKIICYFEGRQEFEIADDAAAIVAAYEEQENKL